MIWIIMCLLFTLTVVFVVSVILLEKYTKDYESCYEKMEEDGDAINGYCRGSSNCPESCIGCPYLYITNFKGGIK